LEPCEKGQLLAEIDTPEVDQQLQQSRSNLATAEANLRLAEITKNRYSELLKTSAVSQQDADNAIGTYNANNSIVQANQANVKQLETLQSFEKIYAPFDALLPCETSMWAISSTPQRPRHEDRPIPYRAAGKLRVYVYVPQEYSKLPRQD